MRMDAVGRLLLLGTLIALIPACGSSRGRGGTIGGAATVTEQFITNVLTAGSGAWQTAVGDLNGDGFLDLVVTNAAANSVSIFLSNGNGTFQAPTTLTTGIGTFPTGVQLVDLNDDGKLDLVVVNFSSGTLSVLQGDGAGGFTAFAGSPITVGTSPEYVIVTDFNGDGVYDIAVSNAGSNNITILLGNGSGTFTAQTPVATGTQPFGMVAGDFDRDGKMDLAVVNAADNTVSILLGNGSGGFSAAGPAVMVGAGPRLLVRGDFNQDGFADLAVTNLTDSTVSLLLGDGTGHFTAGSPIALAAGAKPRGIVTADLNGDGIPDLLVTNTSTNTISFLAGNGAGGFGSPVDIGTGAASGPFFAAAGDFDRDGRVDVAVVLAGKNELAVMLNGSIFQPKPGTFGPAVKFTSGTFPFSVAAGDLNGDGIPDLLVGALDGTVKVYLGDGSGAFVPAPIPSITAGTAIIGLVVGDFNQDSKLDFAASDDGGNAVVVMLGNGDGTFSAAPGSPIAVAGTPAGLVAGRFSGSGFLDLAVAQFGLNQVLVLKGAGDGTFASTGPFSTGVGSGPWGIAAADIDGDGHLDLVTANHGGGGVTVLRGDGMGGFSPAPGSPFATGQALPYNIAAADFDGDGRADVVISSQSGFAQPRILYGTSTGALSTATELPVVSSCFGVAAGDLNGDGRPDLVLTDASAGTVVVLFNLGHREFVRSAQGALPSGTGGGFGPVIVDLNGDGKPDIVAPAEVSSTLSVFMNR